jgi:uncharacterized protein
MTDMKTRRAIYRRVGLLSPATADVVVEDVAWALGRQCRFGGHSLRYYSVAEHSLLVEQVGGLVLGESRPEALLSFLLHDAARAYLRDAVETGAKDEALSYADLFPGYRELELAWEARCRQVLGCAWDGEVQAKVEEACALAAGLEKYYLFKSVRYADKIATCVHKGFLRVRGRSPETAGVYFLERYRQLAVGDAVGSGAGGAA